MQYVNLAKGPRGGPSARTKLDGVRYTVECVWNAVEESWGLQLYDLDGVLMRAGLTLRHGVDVLDGNVIVAHHMDIGTQSGKCLQ